MSDRPVIVVRFCNTAGQWQAWFEGSPCVTYGGEFSMQAAHRLLDGHGTPAGELELHVDQGQPGHEVLLQAATWQPPELLLKCSHCGGKGEYVGLATIEKCGRCSGRGWIPA